jgi:hypothetical protein
MRPVKDGEARDFAGSRPSQPCMPLIDENARAYWLIMSAAGDIGQLMLVNKPSKAVVN